MNGSLILDDLMRFIRRFVVLAPAQVEAIVLWAAHAHALDAFDVTAYLALTSAEKRSGKSRLMEVIELVVPSPLSAVNISDAALFRAIEEMQPVLLLDEADAIFGAKARDREDLRGMLNAGWRRGAKTYRMGGSNNRKLEDFTVFCAKAFAGIGNYLPDTLADRAITLRLERRIRDEAVERLRRREASAEGELLRDRLADWLEPQVDYLRDARPELPDELDDRASDYWEPLLAIADLAGGDWSARARAAAIELSSGETREDESLSIRLIADVKQVFDTTGAGALKTSVLISELSVIEESPWGDWYGKQITSQMLSKLLRPYGIKTMAVWVEGVTVRGYGRRQFEEAWQRYLPLSGVRGVRSVRSEAPRDAGPNAANAPNALHTNGEVEGARFWLARDGLWHSFEDEPPAFPSEVVATADAPPGDDEPKVLF